MRPKVVLIGDSLTQQGGLTHGWASLLAQHYQRKADVVNRGYSGYNTAWAGATLFPPLVSELSSQRVALATLWFGANDAALADGASANQHVPLEQYAENLRGMVGELQRVAEHVVILTPPPVDDLARAAEQRERTGDPGAPAERTDESAARYAEACAKVRGGDPGRDGGGFAAPGRPLSRDPPRPPSLSHRGTPPARPPQVAADTGVGLLDVRAAFLTAPGGGWRSLLSDGLHLTPDGNRAVHDALVASLPASCQPANLPLDLPLWSDLAAPASS